MTFEKQNKYLVQLFYKENIKTLKTLEGLNGSKYVIKVIMLQYYLMFCRCKQNEIKYAIFAVYSLLHMDFEYDYCTVVLLNLKNQI